MTDAGLSTSAKRDDISLGAGGSEAHGGGSGAGGRGGGGGRGGRGRTGRSRAGRGARGGGGSSGGARGRKSGPPSGRAPRSDLWRVVRVALALALLVAATYALLVFGYGNLGGPGSGREVELEWPRSLSPEAAAARLAAAGLVAYPTWFSLYLRATGHHTSLRPGHHLLTDDMSASALAHRMQKGPSRHRGIAKVTLREGVTRFDIAKRLQAARVCGAKAFLAASNEREFLAELGIPAASAEGYLFPATYELALDSEPRDVLKRLKGEFDKRFERIVQEHQDGVSSLRNTLGWGPHQIVILASIIEKEAMADEERPVIASVFLNRLREPTFVPRRLQSDPTSGYGCLVNPELYSCRNYTGRILPEMNSDEANAYSTYRHDGLPPGPISNPSEKTLRGVVSPADTRYLYFMARGEGHHIFSETYAQHNEAIRKVRSMAEAAAGRAATPSP